MIFNLRELLDIFLMVAVLYFVFKDVFTRSKVQTTTKEKYDPLAQYSSRTSIFKGFKLNKQGLFFTLFVVAPAIILHELGHKFTAIFFGASAEFFASKFGLVLALVLKLANFPFIIFVPAYVRYSGALTPFQSAAIAFMGPFVNLVIFIVSYLLIKYGNVDRKYLPYLVLARNLNLFLFGFNMIPIGGFDGAHVFSSLLKGFGF